MSVSLFEHPLFAPLLVDPEIAALFDLEAELGSLLAFERALTKASKHFGLISIDSEQALLHAIDHFKPDLQRLAQGVAKDGVVVPELIKHLRESIDPQFTTDLHKGATSQDVIDTGLLIRLQKACQIIDQRLETLIKFLARWKNEQGNLILEGVTRLQKARPLDVDRKLTTWQAPLERYRRTFDEMKVRVFTIQLGGAVGNRAELGAQADQIADYMADSLGLHKANVAFHTERDRLVEIANWLSLLSGSLGKIGMDIALLAQNGIEQIKLKGGGNSSAMPGKNNPVAAEILVSLARFNASLLSAMHQSLIHENERSGMSWTLEWLTLPQMVATAAASCRLGLTLFQQTSFIAPDQQEGS